MTVTMKQLKSRKVIKCETHWSTKVSVACLHLDSSVQLKNNCNSSENRVFIMTYSSRQASILIHIPHCMLYKVHSLSITALLHFSELLLSLVSSQSINITQETAMTGLVENGQEN